MRQASDGTLQSVKLSKCGKSGVVLTTLVERTCTAVVLYRFPEPLRVAVSVVEIREPTNSDEKSALHISILLSRLLSFGN